jgi:aldose 1-epimerase
VTENRKKKSASVSQSIGGIIVGFDQQIFRTTPPTNELVAKGDPLAAVAAAGGGTMRVGMPGDPAQPPGSAPAEDRDPQTLRLSAPGVVLLVDLAAGGRIASLVVGGHELLKTSGDGPLSWGAFPMAPFAGRLRDATLTFAGTRRQLRVNLPPHAIHGTTFDRRWHLVGDATIATELGPDWPFAGGVVQRFELSADHLTCRMELHADEPMPASIGWHPYFVRRIPGLAEAVELDLDAGAMYVRDAAGIATDELVPPPPGPWDDCFTDLRRAPVLRWPGFLELTIESDCPDWVVYTVPEETICVEPQTAPPDALNADPTVVQSGCPLIAEMTWRWRSLAG